MRSSGQQAVSCEVCPRSFSKKVIACTHRRYKHIGANALTFRKAAPAKPNMLGVPRLLNRSGLTLQRQGCISEPHFLYHTSQRRIEDSQRSPGYLSRERIEDRLHERSQFRAWEMWSAGTGNLSKSWFESHKAKHIVGPARRYREHCGKSPHSMQINFWTTFIWILVTAHLLCSLLSMLSLGSCQALPRTNFDSREAVHHIFVVLCCFRKPGQYLPILARS